MTMSERYMKYGKIPNTFLNIFVPLVSRLTEHPSGANQKLNNFSSGTFSPIEASSGSN